MLALAKSAGARAALSSFGVKVAGAWNDYVESVKRQGIGQPEKAWKQFRKGQLFHPRKGLIGKSLPRTPGEIAAALAWPVMGTLLATRVNPELGGGEVAGDFLGRSVGSLVGAPLGMAGQIGGGLFLAPVGQAVGKAFDSPRSGDVVPGD